MKTGLVVVDAWSVTMVTKCIKNDRATTRRPEHLKTNVFSESIQAVAYLSGWLPYGIPRWSSEVRDNIKNFSNFLNYVCEVERQKGTTIIHSLGVSNSKLLNTKKGEASELMVDEKDKITFSTKLGKTIYENNIDEVYFCGFHFGKCIQTHIVESNIYLKKNNKRLWKKNKNIALNLCMVLPPGAGDTDKPGYSWKAPMNEEIALGQYGMRSFNYFMWSPWRFEEILGRK